MLILTRAQGYSYLKGGVEPLLSREAQARPAVMEKLTAHAPKAPVWRNRSRSARPRPLPALGNLALCLNALAGCLESSPFAFSLGALFEDDNGPG